MTFSSELVSYGRPTLAFFISYLWDYEFRTRLKV